MWEKFQSLFRRIHHDPVLDELLGCRGSAFPEYQRERRELYDAGHFADAAALWTPADRAELSAIKALKIGKSPADACRSIHRTPYSMMWWVGMR